MMKTLNNRYLFIFLGLFSIITVGVYEFFKDQTYYEFLIWNLFLAWIPYLLALAASYIHKQKSTILQVILLLVFALGWLLFLPNSPYVLTDFIHLTIMKHTYAQNGNLTYRYWYDFYTIFLFAWNGLLLGCSSMYIMHLIARRMFNAFLSWIGIGVTSLLCGYGILLGREYRLNSWDALLDTNIWGVLRMTLSRESVLFCFVVGLVVLMVYATFYFIINGLGTNARSDQHH
ncbi:DUF1361 domain-containing protein [Paenibacillus alba]|uniref:DUF1361 domain-containing protein n=1 Tax=Paenibacillus alba TaxID=1197127 RepID=UPI0015678C8C|nr:DUF1361 domain-containing protein [Paenibacillus alba]NQX71229.1 DUF1361 domain-containing protein [Paenibacillus alba]